MTIWILAVALLALAGPSQAAVAVRVLLGVGDQANTDWSGGVTAQGATIAKIEPWRFDGTDAMLPGNRWKMMSRQIRLFGAPATAPPANAPKLQFAPTTPVSRPFSSNGVVILLTGETEDIEPRSDNAARRLLRASERDSVRQPQVRARRQGRGRARASVRAHHERPAGAGSAGRRRGFGWKRLAGLSRVQASPRSRQDPQHAERISTA